MDARSQQIVKDLEDKRERLGQNLEELETKVRDATNWRTYFNRNPWPILAAALTGGLFLSALFFPRAR